MDEVTRLEARANIYSANCQVNLPILSQTFADTNLTDRTRSIALIIRSFATFAELLALQHQCR
jgi:hypothetical protein